MTTDSRTDLSVAERVEANPEAPEGIRNPVRPDDDEQVEGHGYNFGLGDDVEGRGTPESNDESDDVEGHWSRVGC